MSINIMVPDSSEIEDWLARPLQMCIFTQCVDPSTQEVLNGGISQSVRAILGEFEKKMKIQMFKVLYRKSLKRRMSSLDGCAELYSEAVERYNEIVQSYLEGILKLLVVLKPIEQLLIIC